MFNLRWGTYNGRTWKKTEDFTMKNERLSDIHATTVGSQEILLKFSLQTIWNHRDLPEIETISIIIGPPAIIRE